MNRTPILSIGEAFFGLEIAALRPPDSVSPRVGICYGSATTSRGFAVAVAAVSQQRPPRHTTSSSDGDIEKNQITPAGGQAREVLCGTALLPGRPQRFACVQAMLLHSHLASQDA